MIIIFLMVIEIGAAKTGQFDSIESDETTEIIERPAGGQTIVYCRGRRNGRKSKTISSVIVNKILEKITESIRDSIAIRSVSDQILRAYAGETCGDLCVISADFESETIVVSRCTNCPVYCYSGGTLNEWNTPSEPIASSKGMHPSITEIPIQPGTVIVMLSEGILNAGHGISQDDDLEDIILSLAEDGNEQSADDMAAMLLQHAVRMDQNRPQDDMTAIVMKVKDYSPSFVRRVRLTCPVPKHSSIFD